MIVRITDPADPRLDRFRWRERQLASRSERAETVGAGMFVAEGDLVVERAVAAGSEPVALLCDDRFGGRYAEVFPGVDVYVGDDELRRDVTGLGVPLAATGLFRRPALLDPAGLVASSRRIVALEAVDNPTNVGAIVRSAAALGWDALLLDATSADPLARRALRVSMGAGLVLPFARLSPGEPLAGFLAGRDATVVGLTPDASARDIAEVSYAADEKVVLMLGSERAGLSQGSLAGSRELVRIPMHRGVDSLNVGAAAAIALHRLA